MFRVPGRRLERCSPCEDSAAVVHSLAGTLLGIPMHAASSTLQMRSVPTDPNSTVMTPRSQSRVLWMTCIRVLVAMTLLLCMSEVSRAQSDDCSAPPPISGEGFFTYDATGASTTGFSGGGVCSPYLNLDVFWVWTPQVSGDYYFRTCSGGTDSEINLHLGGDCSATCLATADTGACAYEWTKATMRVDGLVAGQDHLLQRFRAWGSSTSIGVLRPIPASGHHQPVSARLHRSTRTCSSNGRPDRLATT